MSLADAIRDHITNRKPPERDETLTDSVAVSLRERQGGTERAAAEVGRARDLIRSTKGPHEIRDRTGRTIGTVALSELNGGRLMVEIGHARHSLTAVFDAIPGATVHAKGGEAE